MFTILTETSSMVIAVAFVIGVIICAKELLEGVMELHGYSKKPLFSEILNDIENNSGK